MKKSFNFNLEALRGFCAIMVVLHHAVTFSDVIGNNYDVQDFTGYYAFNGHTMVLIFFVLSGYVIGINYYKKDNYKIKEYLQKRFIRLYPIYLFSILFTILVSSENVVSVLGVSLFFQNLFTNNLLHNGSLWSLNHEIVYYLLAIPILKYKINLKYIFPALIVLLLASVSGLKFPMIVEGYLVGFIFWLTGFQLSVYTTLNRFISPPVSINKFLAVLFLILASDINVMHYVMSILPIQHGESHYTSDYLLVFNDFARYFICVYTIVSMITSKWNKLLSSLAYSYCWIAAIKLAVDGSLFTNNFFHFPFFFLSASTFLFFYKKPLLKSTGFLIYLGSISYAMYVIHYPVLYLIGTLKEYNDTLLYYCIRVSILLGSVIIIAHFLEKILQPKISGYFKHSPSTLSANSPNLL